MNGGGKPFIHSSSVQRAYFFLEAIVQLLCMEKGVGIVGLGLPPNPSIRPLMIWACSLSSSDILKVGVDGTKKKKNVFLKKPTTFFLIIFPI